ncbi:hypothetical protein QOZ80_8BG0643670 [Eleusine coracana subsp. coracana]|nr:hypothetical protein QOZ80_8BG0643670 [Eleusine coracana subsp. coracana]
MMEVTPTHRCTHAVHIRNFSTLRKEHCGGDGSVASPPFTVGGLDWTLRYYPDGDDGHVGAYLELATPGAAAWARVGIQVLDQSTVMLPVPGTAVWEDDPTLFDASSPDTSAWGVSNLALRSHLLDSGHVSADDRITIECVVDVCLDSLSFPDPPSPIPNNHLVPVAGDMPPPAAAAFVHFLRTDTIPLVRGMTGEGYRDVLRHLLLAGAPRLAAICERLLCRHGIDVDSVSATLAMADRHGFGELRDACVEFASDPYNYPRVRGTEGYYTVLWREAPHLARELAVKWARSYGVDLVYDEQTSLPLEISGPTSQLCDFPETTWSQLLPLSQTDNINGRISHFSPDVINMKMEGLLFAQKRN